MVPSVTFINTRRTDNEFATGQLVGGAIDIVQ